MDGEFYPPMDKRARLHRIWLMVCPCVVLAVQVLGLIVAPSLHLALTVMFMAMWVASWWYGSRIMHRWGVLAEKERKREQWELAFAQFQRDTATVAHAIRARNGGSNGKPTL